jgi:hypothetical protein
MTALAQERQGGMPARSDRRPRARRVLVPVGVLVGSAAALGYVWAVDPNEPGHYPLCPTKFFLGIDCPGCGIMRGTHDLVHGNVAGALDHNVLLAVLAPMAVVAWVVWALRSWTGRSPEATTAQMRRRHRLMVVGLVVLVAFGIVRNFVPYLGSGIG